MLHVILLILKIIGVIILAVLGLLLFLLLVVLLVPVRYQLRASHGENLYLKGRVSWLLHLVHASVTHIEGILHIKVRLLGFIVYDNLRPSKPKKEKVKKSAKKKADRKVRSENVVRKSSSTLPANFEKAVDEEKKSIVTLDKPEPTNIKAEDSKSEIIEKPQIVDRRKTIDDIKIVDDIKTIDEIKTVKKEDDTEKAEDNNTENSEERKKVFGKLIEKLKGMLEKLKENYRKLKEKLQAIRESIRSKFEKIRNIHTDIKHKWELIYHFLTDELNKQGIHLSFESLKKLLKHILPTSYRGEIIFGTGDPYSTGQVLSILSVLYGFYGDKVSVIPDFENSRFEGKHYARGRIRAATILIIACKLLLDKRFKYLKKNFLLLKEAL